MRIARGDHRQSADLRVLEGVSVVAAQRRRGVENFDRIDGQRFQNGKTNAGAEEIVRVRWNRETAALMNDFANFARRSSFQLRWIRQSRADAKKMAVGRCHFDSR